MSARSYPQTNFSNGQGKHLKPTTRGRFDQFVGGHYSSVNLTSCLFTNKTDASSAVKLEVWSPKAGEKPSFEVAARQKYKPAQKGDRFGPSWSNHWFKITIHVPREYSKYDRVQFEFDPGCEGLIYTPEGVPIHGLVGGYDSLRRVEHVLDAKARKGPYHIFIEISCNGMFGVPQGGNEIEPPDPNRFFTLDRADLVVPNLRAWALMDSFNLLKQIANYEDTSSALSERAMHAANAVMSTFRIDDSERTIEECLKICNNIIGHGWEGKKEGVWKEGVSDDKSVLWAIGHCHIDSAWLWPFSVTKQKVARSWSTQVDLMDRYPEHTFSATSAAQYDWLEKLYPSLFDKVKAKIDKGQFGVIGATWVEMDTNLPSGESLARQFLMGQNFFESRFGKRCETFVLPDTFGYSPQLPQIASLGGTRSFFTQKISWNQTNLFPHSTFNWVGLDGSQLLTHMTPVDSYNAQVSYDEIMKGAKKNKNLEVTQDALFLFGNGDGGGGPIPPMIERLRRFRSLANNNREVPALKFGGLQMEDFFNHLRKQTDNGKTLPVWKGELYLELHRGTYTSHAATKRGNRKLEIFLREVEYAATLASVSTAKSADHYVYPKKELETSWEKLLLCQFHDVLPGSAIRLAYDECDRWYAEIAESCTRLLEDALSVLFPSSSPIFPTKAPVFGMPGGKVIGINSSRAGRREVVKVKLDKAGELKRWAGQVGSDGKEGYLLVDARGTGAAEVTGLFADTKGVSATSLDKDTHVLSSSSVKLTIKEGRISSIKDLDLGRELIAQNQTGGFVIFEDQPNYWDAWDTDIFHLETPTHLKFTSVRVAETGPLRASLAVKVQFGQSVIDCIISLDSVGASVRRDARSLIRFETRVDWRERHRFLKFELPTTIHAMDATYETQFGFVNRPTHRNTSWEVAKFEVCAHKFADLSEFGYGVSIVNDCKYGYAVDGNVMRLSLLRSPTSPDPEQDQGENIFSFGIYPHAGTFAESDVPHVAAAFNAPIHLRYVPTSPSITRILGTTTINSLVTVEHASNVVAETVKRAEADDFSAASTEAKHIIVRLYEAYGGHAKAIVRIAGLNVASVRETNILEDDLGSELTLQRGPAISGDDADDTFVELNFRGFEIKTLKIKLGSGKPQATGEEWIRVDKK